MQEQSPPPEPTPQSPPQPTSQPQPQPPPHRASTQAASFAGTSGKQQAGGTKYQPNKGGSAKGKPPKKAVWRTSRKSKDRTDDVQSTPSNGSPPNSDALRPGSATAHLYADQMQLLEWAGMGVGVPDGQGSAGGATGQGAFLPPSSRPANSNQATTNPVVTDLHLQRLVQQQQMLLGRQAQSQAQGSTQGQSQARTQPSVTAGTSNAMATPVPAAAQPRPPTTTAQLQALFNPQAWAASLTPNPALQVRLFGLSNPASGLAVGGGGVSGSPGMTTQGMHGGPMGQAGQVGQGLVHGVLPNMMSDPQAMLQAQLLQQQAQGPAGTSSPSLRPMPTGLPGAPGHQGSPYNPQFGTAMGPGSSPTPSPAQRAVPSLWGSQMGLFLAPSPNPATPTPSMVQASPLLGQVGSPMVSSPLAQPSLSSQLPQPSQPSQPPQESQKGTGMDTTPEPSTLSLQAMLPQPLQQPQLPNQPTTQQANQFSQQMFWHQLQFQQMLQLAHSQVQTSLAPTTQGGPGKGPSSIGFGRGQ